MTKSKRPLTVTFWGTRGSIPTPGPTTLKYGGNTACTEIRYGPDALILDGGTGLRLLGINHSGNRQRSIPILISHCHMDHIAGIPFFAPALHPKQQLKIYGPPGLKKALAGLFPFSVLRSQKKIYEIRAKELRIPPFRISSLWLNHPGNALAYRILTPDGRSLLYISDHEPSARHHHTPQAPSDSQLLRWMGSADLLIMDAQYFDHEYRTRRGWGHSPLTYTVQLALQAKAKKLVLFHHDPTHSDRILQKKLQLAKRLIAQAGVHLSCSLAQEGQTLTL